MTFKINSFKNRTYLSLDAAVFFLPPKVLQSGGEGEGEQREDRWDNAGVLHCEDIVPADLYSPSWLSKASWPLM